MPIMQWFGITMDRRGSINLPAQIKGIHGFQPGSIFYLRSVGEAFILIPLERVREAATDLQRDLATAAYINAVWDQKAALCPPLVEAASAPSHVPEHEQPIWEGERTLVTMNKKGFIPTPDAMKEQLRLDQGDTFITSVQRTPDFKTVIVIEPTASVDGALMKHLAKERERHLADEKRELRLASYEIKIKEMEQYEKELAKRIKDSEQIIARNRTQKQEPSFPFPLLNQIVTPQAEPARPTQAPDEGMRWSYNAAVGWVQVANIDD